MLPLESPDIRRSPWLTGILLALAAVSIGYAIHMRDGEYSYRVGYNPMIAVHWVGVAILLVVAGFSLARLREPRWAERALLTALAACVGFQFLQLFRSPPSGWNTWSNDLRPIDVSLRPFYAGITACAVLTIGLFFRGPIVRRVCLSLILIAHLLLGIWTIRATPEPKIDVFVFQQQAAQALLHGKNPYALAYDDIYKSDRPAERKVYGDEMTKDGKTAFGFPYPPVSLLMSTAGYAAAGDYRYAQVVAMTLAGALLAFSSTSRVAAIAGVLLLFTPRAFFILGRGWSEPLVVVLLAAVIFCALRAPKLLPIALGLFLASKQYLILAAPAALILAMAQEDRRRALGLVWKSIAVAAVVTLPLALWNWNAYWRSTMTVQDMAPFRDDALSYLVWWKMNIAPTMFGKPLDQAYRYVALTAYLLAAGLALWRAPRSVAGFAAALGLLFIPFIAFNKQAFANYYYFTIACLCAAVGTMAESRSSQPPDEI